MGPFSLEDLVVAFVERRESGERLTPEEYAATHPEGGLELLNLLHEVAAVDSLLGPAEAHFPEQIGPWRILGEVGRGATGIVLRAEHGERPNGSVAVKLLFAAAGSSFRMRERFRREGAVLGRLDHHGIVHVHATGVAGGSPFIVMDLVDGVPLSRLLAAARAGVEGSGNLPPAARIPGFEGRDPYRSAAAFTGAIARALAAAHAEGLVHRDLKPSNVMVRRDGSPVILDFGLAGDPESPDLTLTGDVVGTPMYMAPEQARGEGVDFRADVFAAGAILHEMLTLRPPRDGRNSAEILGRARKEPLSLAHRWDPRIPRDLEALLRRATAFRPEARYGSAAELALQLEFFAAGRDVQSQPLSRRDRALESWLRHRRAIITLIFMVLLAAGATLAVRTLGAEEASNLEARRLAVIESATLAQLDANLAELGAAADRMEVLAGPGDPWTKLLKSMASGTLPETSAIAGVSHLIEGERLRRDGHPREAQSRLKSAIGLLPRNPLPVALLGTAAKESGQLDVAHAELTSAARLLPESAAVLRLLAEVEVERGEVAEAVNLMEKAVLLAPADPRIWYAKARVEHRAGLKEAGLASIREALRFYGSPGEEILNAYAALLDAGGRSAEAQGVFREILARSPRRTTTLFNLALSLDRVHEVPEAESHYLRVLESDPEHVPALAALSWLYTAACQTGACTRPHVRNLEQAESLYLLALRVDAGRTKGLIQSAALMAQRIGRGSPILATLESLLSKTEDMPASGWVHAAIRAVESLRIP